MGLAVGGREGASIGGWPRCSPATRTTPTTRLGRLIDYLEQTGELDNTLIVWLSDNGASGEGGPNGSINENIFFNGVLPDMKDNLAKLDVLGSPETYNHYSNGWAFAFNTPNKMFKRHTWEGGVADPMIVHWPKGIKAKGEVRDQYAHCSDVVPTVYECLGIEPPEVVKGYTQWDLEGTSFRYSFDDAKAKTQKPQPVLRDARDSRDLARRLEGRRRCTPVHRRTGATSPRTSGRCTTSKKTAPRSTTSPTSTPSCSRS